MTMNTFRYIIVLLLFPASLLGQTSTENYIKTTDYRVETTTGNNIADGDKVEAVSYADGLGRPVQSINARGGGDREDIVSYMEYTDFGVQSKEYLPWANSGASSMNYITPSTLLLAIENFYDTPKYEGTTEPYSESSFEPSPLFRVDERGAPGNDWKVLTASDADHTVKFGYELNELTDNILRLAVDFIGDDFSDPDLILDTTEGTAEVGIYFSAARLTKTITKDENWSPSQTYLKDHTTEEFTNKKGQVALKRTYEGNIAHDTYYVYDDFGNLTYVLSPEASAQILNGSVLATNYQDILDDLGYQYKYDHRNRLIWKKIPGKEYELIVYDKLDRPVLTQDKNLRDDDQWLFTKYDPMGRVAYTGVYTTTATQQTIITAIEGQTIFSEAQDASTPAGDISLNYTNGVYPTAGITVLTINYYDSYVDTAGLVLPGSTALGTTISSDTKSLATVSKARVLGTADWITSMTGYDDKSRPIYIASFNDYLDTTDVHQSLLDFTGNPTETISAHARSGYATIITRDYFTYDHAGRLLTAEQQLDDEPLQLIVSNVYDELGQLVRKDVGGETFLDGYTDITNADVIGQTTIEKTSGSGSLWDAGAKTRGEVSDDGGVSYSVPAFTTLRVGVDKTSSSNSWDDFDFGLDYSALGTGSTRDVKLIINGVVGSTAITQYEVGDEFSIERDGIDIIFKKEGTTFHTETDNSFNNGEPLIAKVGLKGVNGRVDDFQLFGPNIDLVLQNVDYAYNVRGWLTDINDIAYTGSKETDIFNFRINYNDVEGAATAAPLYNGNISQTLWKTNNSSTDIRSYGYSYDVLNRIEGALSYKGATLAGMSLTGNHDVSGISYDKNGNIQGLTRKGYDDTGTSTGVWDQLQYTYDGNKLTQVSDITLSGLKNYGFDDDNTGTNEYLYDDNGNMTRDDNKGITSITYNHLNLPTSVIFGTTGQIDYIYDATGIKQKKTVVNYAATTTSVTEYAGSFIYSDMGTSTMALQFFNHPEGYVEPVAGTSGSVKGSSGGTTTYSAYNYVFQFKDHLGNVRLSYADADNNGAIAQSEIIEESNYYPFGLKQKGYSDVVSGGNDLAQQWKFGGKQYQEELGLDWYDVSARNYDPAIGRWFVIDPLADARGQIHSTPYGYALNNPIVFNDPDGNCPPGVDCLSVSLDNSLAGHGGSTNTSVSRSGTNIGVSTSLSIGNATISNSTNISLGPNVRQGHVTNKSAVVIAKNLVASGNSSARITSAYREPSDQARVMFDNIESKGANNQKRLYGPSGDKVIDVHTEAKESDGVNTVAGLITGGAPQVTPNSEIKSAMTDKINEVGPGKVSKHSSDPNTYNVIDISPRSLTNGSAFGNSVKNDSNIKKVITPPTDPAYHLEIPQNNQ